MSSKIGSGSRTTLVLPMLFEFLDICVVSTAHECEIGGFPVHLYEVKIFIWISSSNSARVHVLGWSLLQFFSNVLKEGLWVKIICRDYIAL